MNLVAVCRLTQLTCRVPSLRYITIALSVRNQMSMIAISVKGSGLFVSSDKSPPCVHTMYKVSRLSLQSNPYLRSLLLFLSRAPLGGRGGGDSSILMQISSSHPKIKGTRFANYTKLKLVEKRLIMFQHVLMYCF